MPAGSHTVDPFFLNLNPLPFPSFPALPIRSSDGIRDNEVQAVSSTEEQYLVTFAENVLYTLKRKCFNMHFIAIPRVSITACLLFDGGGLA